MSSVLFFGTVNCHSVTGAECGHRAARKSGRVIRGTKGLPLVEPTYECYREYKSVLESHCELHLHRAGRPAGLQIGKIQIKNSQKIFSSSSLLASGSH